MRIVTFLRKTDLVFGSTTHRMTVSIDPYKPYIMPDVFYQSILDNEKIRSQIYKVSDFRPRNPYFNKRAVIPGSSVLVYNGSGGYGDQIMTWPLLSILNRLGYKVSVLFDPGNHFCYYGLDFLKSSHVSVIQKSIVDMYDSVLFMDTVVNADEHADQLHPVDTMLNLAGIEPSDIEDSEKVFRPNFFSSEYEEAEKIRNRILGNGKFIIFQTDSSSVTRRLPEEAVYSFLVALADRFSDHKILCIGDFRDRINLLKYLYKDTSGDISQKLNDPSNIKDPRLIPYRASDLRVLWALTEKASCVVGFDSMMVHVSGSLGVPCVSMWGPIDPMKRIAYYDKSVPLADLSACQHAHCFHAKKEFPPYCPTGQLIGCCGVMSGIKPEEVCDAVASLITEKSTEIVKNNVLPYEF